MYTVQSSEVLEEIEISIEDMLAEIEGTRNLLIYNDDHNTFDWVISCLIQVCGHSQIQSEQLAHIIHFNGKATIKSGSFDNLRPFKDALCDKGLSAVIE